MRCQLHVVAQRRVRGGHAVFSRADPLRPSLGQGCGCSDARDKDESWDSLMLWGVIFWLRFTQSAPTFLI